MYYTLENTTDTDYEMPPVDELRVNARLKREKGLSSASLMKIDDRTFIPAKQRMRFAVHLRYPVTEVFADNPTTKEEQRKKWTGIIAYLNKDLPNVDGFVIFDQIHRYQINLPGWSSDLN